jgi:hypothetical protein
MSRLMNQPCNCTVHTHCPRCNGADAERVTKGVQCLECGYASWLQKPTPEAQAEPPDPLAGLKAAKYLNPACAELGCQFLQPRQQQAEQIAALHSRTWTDAEHITALEAQNRALREALTSIANNSCCTGCQEAKLVARAALATPGIAKEE